MIPVPLIWFEALTAIWGEALVKPFYHPVSVRK